MVRKIVTGDIHGSFKALKQCLERSKFDYENDILICLGDTCDGYPETNKCFEELVKIKNLVYVIGNHDCWFYKWIVLGNKFKKEDRQSYDAWYYQGGKATIKSYDRNNSNVPKKVKNLLSMIKGKYYYLDDKNRLFVHGGVDLSKPLIDNTIETFIWDRSIIDKARELRADNEIYGTDFKLEPYKEIYVGHTDISNISKVPLRIVNLICMDTGCGWSGCLTFMDIDTKQYWQSDKTEILYGKYYR